MINFPEFYYSIFGIGNPLMDFIVNMDFDFLNKLQAHPGSMNLISDEERKNLFTILKKFNTKLGGSCANTLRGFAWLSKQDAVDPPLYTGAIGKDDIGKKYKKQMEKLGIIVNMAKCQCSTGLSIIINTPDNERTMFTYLGACQEYSEDDLNIEQLKQSKILYTTGYMWDTESQKKAIYKATEVAKNNSVTIVFDLADPFVVKRNREEFLEWIPQNVDILFGNFDEIVMMIEENHLDNRKDIDKEDLIKKGGFLAPIVIMKTGAEGCYVNEKGNILKIPGKKVKVVDTIGAGDIFASGFLFGLIKERKVRECAVLANSFAAGIVTLDGCNISKLNQKEILSCWNSTD